MRISAEDLARKYQENVFRAAFSICRNRQDAEDVVQETFLAYLRTRQEFESEEHIRAWLLRTALNKAKNVRGTFWHRNRETLQEYTSQVPFAEPEDRELAEAVLALPEKYRIVLHLYYYEDYSIKEIGQMLHLSDSAVKNRLLRARKQLKSTLKEGWANE